MAKGLQKYQERKHALSLFGKDLTRRSHGHCEICNASGVSLSIFEVPPVTDEPDIDHCLFACEVCKEQIENPKRRDANHWHCLSHSVWSEVPCVQVMAVLMLETLQDHDWAMDLQEQLYLMPEIEEWLVKARKDFNQK